ncbi:MAG: hypothetical protein AAB600_03745 [Patescibacteria group bacterium]
MKRILAWYKKHYTLNVGIASFLFIWQLIHLYWLTTHVAFNKLFGIDLFNPKGIMQTFIVIADYSEIPALILTSFVYIFGFFTKFSWKNILFLFLLNSQWFHLFWITDEFVIEQLTGSSAKILPIWLAWFAIFIDYLELPVIYDTLKKFFVSLRKKA